MSEHNRLNDLKNKLELLYEKLWSFEKELVITSSPMQKFELRQRIKDCKQEIANTKIEINSYKEDEINVRNQKTQTKFSSQDQFVTNTQAVLMKDIFICHASEDKQQVVEPLVKAFDQANISYWYDKAEIKWGDSITKKVNEGLSISRFVIVVLSSAFLDKNWPQRELLSVLNIEASSGEVKILPLIIGNNIKERETIIQQFPLLNDKAYLVWTGDGNDIINQLLRIDYFSTPK